MSFSSPANTDHSDARDSKRPFQLVYENISIFQNDLTDLGNRLTGEINIDSILALDEEIREHEKAIIKLKRARNSLLNVSKFPPEVLGEIFRCNVTFKDDFGGLKEGSHNFLLVCHHWFQVASCTPELWSFWGNTTRDWMRWHSYSGSVPLDLVLDGRARDRSRLDVALYNELRDRATKDIIRQVHLKAQNQELLDSILSSLTVECEGTPSNSVQSFVLWNWGSTPVDVTDFFARYCFPKLRRLDLTNCTISWNPLTSRTGALTTLDLGISSLSPTPTTSQLLLVLSSNPLLQKIALGRQAIPQDDDGTSSAQVPLHDLKELELEGGLRDVIRLFHRFDHPKRMDSLTLTLDDCSAVDISQIIGPCLLDYLQGRGRSQHGSRLLLSFEHEISLHIGGVHGINPLLRQMDTFMTMFVRLNEALHGNAREMAILDLITHVPGEEIAHLQMLGDPVTTRNMYSQFPNLRALSFAGAPLRYMFSEPDLGRDRKILPSLQHISLHEFGVGHGDWSPLINFLACRVSSGNRLGTLEISGSPHMRPEVMEAVRGMVRELKFQ